MKSPLQQKRKSPPVSSAPLANHEGGEPLPPTKTDKALDGLRKWAPAVSAVIAALALLGGGWYSVSQLLGRLGGLEASVDQQKQALTGKIDGQGDILTEKIDRQGDVLTEKIDGQGKLLRAEIKRQGDLFAERLGRVQDKVEVVDDKIDRVEATLDRRLTGSVSNDDGTTTNQQVLLPDRTDAGPSHDPI